MTRIPVQVRALADAVVEDNFRKCTHFAVMLFYENPDNPGAWVNRGTMLFTDPDSALSFYADTPCPASQLLSAKSYNEISDSVDAMRANFSNPKWLEENLYPYL